MQQTWSQRVKTRDSICRICNAAWTRESHHIIGRANKELKDDDLNGLGLCTECHKKIHSAGMKIPARALTKEQVEYVIKNRWPDWKKIDWKDKLPNRDDDDGDY